MKVGVNFSNSQKEFGFRDLDLSNVKSIEYDLPGTCGRVLIRTNDGIQYFLRESAINYIKVTRE